VTHAERKLILQAHARHGRRKHGVFIAEGLRCCREGLARQPQALLAAVCTRGFADSADAAAVREQAGAAGRTLEVLEDERAFAALTATENAQGLLCLFRDLPAPAPLAALPGPFVLVLDRVAEPGNLGTILRTAWAVGLCEAWLTEGTTDPFGPKAIRAGMGAQFALALRAFADLAAVEAELRRLGGDRLWCSVPRGGVDGFSAEFALAGGALVIGNEAGGIDVRPGQARVTIPMPGEAESLNAAQAATVLLFEAVRRGLLGPAPRR
jgi:TrmH family RNA methyltransferase